MLYSNKFHFRLKTSRGLVMLLITAMLGLLGFWVNGYFKQGNLSKGNHLPAQHYQPLKSGFPYQFEYSIHAHLLPATSRHTMDYWVNLYYPDFDATIYLSYQSVTDNQALLNDWCKNASALAFQHQVKASSIEESIIQTPKGHQAHVIELFGEVATPFQFYTTDGKKHFLRAALYFKTASQNDALAPVIAYIKKDMIHMLNTLEWKA
ncbi:gliding motility lipoprotein GldD [Cardinium endosymbiont of Nabis limbatus]|uniref:gliding motility lipoprotein GldD n=1 Tax=Cardinium endosymbiont of Nabis limbatus TaxID=3066217 RepID=UPI003AF39973